MILKGITKLFANKSKKVQTTTKSHYTKEEVKLLMDVEKFHESQVSPEAEALATHFLNLQNPNLDKKVDEFIRWFYKNMVKGQYTTMGERCVPIELRNFIEKMAVWYELRYPKYEINRLMPGSSQEGIEINDVMFNRNRYINDLLDEDSDVRALDWDEFYNAEAFINSLPWEERYIFQEPRYRSSVYIKSEHVILNPDNKTAHLHLNSKGIIEESEGLEVYSDSKVSDEEIKGMHVKEVVKLLKDRGISLPKDNELEATVNNAEKWIYQKEGILDCVMYRIMERGGERIGPRRAFLFAKEFGRNIDIPMMYGIDYSDPGLRKFINEYIKAGGSKDLMCYVGYFSRANSFEMLKKVSIQKLIRTVHNDCATKYTKEETALHQRMVNALASQIDQEEVRKEEVKQSKLQRKLKRSRTRTNITHQY